MSGDSGFLTNVGTRLRDIIRSEARKQAEEFDQVTLATVSDAGDGVTVELLIDGFAGGAIAATWTVPAAPAVDDRVAVLMLRGGQKFFVVGVLGVPPPPAPDHGELPGLGDDDHSQYQTPARQVAHSATRSVGDHVDVVIGAPAIRHVLVYDGVNSFDNRLLVEADISDLSPARTDEEITDLAGAQVTGGIQTFISATRDDPNDEIDLVVPVKDEDDMASNSAVHLVTQQSLVAYLASLIPPAPQHLTYTHKGDLVTGALPFEWIAPFDLNIVGLQARCGDQGPTGAAATFDVHDDGTTAFTTKASIPDGSKGGASQAPSTAFVAAGSVITFEVDAVGSTLPGGDCLITMEYTPASTVAPGTQPFSFSTMEPVETGPRPFEWVVPFDCTVDYIQVTSGLAPTTTSIINDWHKNGTTLFTGGTDRPTILTTTKASDQEVPAVTALVAGDVLTWEIDQKDSADVGRYLTTIIKVTVP